MVGISFKNFNRIYQKKNLVYNNYPWPKIFSDGKNIKNTNKKVMIDDENSFFRPFPANLCYYSSSPCTTSSNKVKYVKNIIGYKAYIIDEN